VSVRVEDNGGLHGWANGRGLFLCGLTPESHGFTSDTAALANGNTGGFGRVPHTPGSRPCLHFGTPPARTCGVSASPPIPAAPGP
jgi:hypothetical protein